MCMYMCPLYMYVYIVPGTKLISLIYRKILIFHCCLSLQRSNFRFERHHSRLLSRWAALWVVRVGGDDEEIRPWHYVKEVPWSEFPTVPSCSHYPQALFLNGSREAKETYMYRAGCGAHAAGPLVDAVRILLLANRLRCPLHNQRVFH